MRFDDAITSASNPRLKLVRRLHARRTREREGCFVVEGEDLVAAGIAAGQVPRFVLADADAIERDGGGAARTASAAAQQAGAPVLAVPPQLLADGSSLAHAARLLGVFDLPKPMDGLTDGQPALVLDGIRDPGNVGTLIRTALMFGVEQIVLGHGTADPFGPKATRASMGGIFHVRLLRPARTAAWLSQSRIDEGRYVIGLDPAGAEPIGQALLPSDGLLCVGSERDGLHDDVREACSTTVAIPQAHQHGGRPDSLNAALAGGILLYEWARQTA